MTRPGAERDTESARLRAVRATGLLDAAPDEAFDRLTRLAAELLDTAAAQITLVDDRRSFWMSFTGPGAAQVPVREQPREDSLCQFVIATGDAFVVGDTVADERTRDKPAVTAMGVQAWAGIPIRGPEGDVLGTFCVIDQRTRAWTPRDLGVLDTLAKAAAGEIALREALSRSRSLAQTLQANLLPPTLPAVPGLDVAAHYRPAGTGTEVLGDFYDLFPTGQHEWAVVLGDVAGQGVDAATLAAFARFSLRAGAVRELRPSRVLASLNEALLAQESDGERFLTAVCALLRPQVDGVDVRLCSAGHTPVLVRRADSGVEVVGEQGTVLGAFPGIALLDSFVRLGPGDAMLLYTDGVVEAHAPGTRELFGQDRLEKLFETLDGTDAAGTVDAIEQAVDAFTDGSRGDDLAVLVLQVEPH